MPKSHRDRRSLLRRLEREDVEIERMGIVDRSMARDHVLHMLGFYNGDIEPDEVRENFVKVKRYIENIEMMGT